MASHNKAVFAIFKTRLEAERAVIILKTAGFSGADISVLLPDSQGTKDFAHSKGTKAPEGAATGAGTGAVLGGALGWLVGIGALAIPGIGPLIAAGPIVSVFAGVGLGGAIGGVSGALIGMGIPEYEAKRYEGHVKDGGILLSVHLPDSSLTSQAERLLEESGGCDIAATKEEKGEEQFWEPPTARPPTGGGQSVVTP